MQFRAHLHTVNRHRRLVRRYCLKLGLVWQGLTHDLSKYSPTEFWRGCKYYQGWRSPNDQERLENGVSLAWLHHKGRNRHHFEYWIDYCRRIAACRVYQGDRYTDASPYDYYQRSKDLSRTDASRFMHADTAALLDRWLLLLKERGEDAAFAAIRQELRDSAF